MCDLICCAYPGPPAGGRAGSVGEIYSQRKSALKKAIAFGSRLNVRDWKLFISAFSFCSYWGESANA